MKITKPLAGGMNGDVDNITKCENVVVPCKRKAEEGLIPGPRSSVLLDGLKKKPARPSAIGRLAGRIHGDQQSSAAFLLADQLSGMARLPIPSSLPCLLSEDGSGVLMILLTTNLFATVAKDHYSRQDRIITSRLQRRFTVRTGAVHHHLLESASSSSWGICGGKKRSLIEGLEEQLQPPWREKGAGPPG